MRNRIFSISPAIPALCLGLQFLICTVEADTVHMIDGRKIEGEFIAQDEHYVVFEMKGSKLHLPIARVAKMQTGKLTIASASNRAARFIEAKQYKKAYLAACKVLSNPDSTPLARLTAQEQKKQALTLATDPIIKVQEPLLKTDRYYPSIRRMQDSIRLAKSNSFEQLKYKQALAAVRLALANHLIEAYQTEKALRVLRVFDNSEAKPLGYHAAMEQIYTNLRDYDKVVVHMVKALDENPSDHVRRNRLFIALGRKHDVSAIVRAWENRPESFSVEKDLTTDGREALAQGLCDNAFVELEKGNVESAISFFELGSELNHYPNSTFYGEAVRFYQLAGDLSIVKRMEVLQELALRRENQFAETQKKAFAKAKARTLLHAKRQVQSTKMLRMSSARKLREREEGERDDMRGNSREEGRGGGDGPPGGGSSGGEGGPGGGGGSGGGGRR